MDPTIEDLREHLVGNRFYDESRDESFTVLAVDAESWLALVQYDDGLSYDLMASPDRLFEIQSEHGVVSLGGFVGEQFHPLGAGPTLANSCEKNEHSWCPRPDDLGWETAEEFDDRTYAPLVRCRRCGLSGETTAEFLGHHYPTLCDRCDGAAIPGESGLVRSPVPAWEGATVCGSCADELEDEDEASAVACFKCGDVLGTTSEYSGHHIPSSSIVGQELGGAEVDDDFFYLCDECWRSVRNAISA